MVKDKKVHWERDGKRRRPSGAERRRRKRAAQEEAVDSDSATPAKTQGKPSVTGAPCRKMDPKSATAPKIPFVESATQHNKSIEKNQNGKT